MDTNTLMLVVIAGFFFGWMVNHAISRGFGWLRTFLYGALAYGSLALLVLNMQPPGPQPGTVAEQAMMGGMAALAGGAILVVLVRLGQRHRRRLLQRLQDGKQK